MPTHIAARIEVEIWFIYSWDLERFVISVDGIN